ncbi:MAG: murein biosynthesis integral membrane protein MurJ [Caldicoprobacterales bacterium]|jgi:putative peptidoglycan lipid II flippase|nr:murein biosynthesis integral membrane protein MurJ [Clostridiales bacterium]
MKKHILVLMAAIVLSKAAAFAKDMVLSYYYGASEISDAYLVSLTIPIVIFGMIGTGIATGYTPLYNEIVREHGPARGVRFTNHLINLTLIACTILFLPVLAFPKIVVRMFASGFSSTAMDTAVTFTRISIIGIYFIGIFYVFEAFLHQNGSYSISGFSALPVNLLVMAAIAISVKTDKLVLSIGSVISVILHTLSLIYFSYRKGYRYHFGLDFRDTYLKKMILLVLPLIIGSSAYQINQVVERTIASQIAVGGITTLSYAQKLVSFIKDIFVLSIVTVLYPNISRMAAGSHMISFKKTVSDAAVGICLLMIPSTIGVMIFSKPIIELLFRRGAFDANAVSMTSEALFFYSLGMTALGIRSVLVKAFYSLKDVKTPVKNSAISIVSNILLNVLLAKSFGIAGLALASSISGGLAVSLLYFSLKNKIGPMDIKSFAASLLKIILISLGMGLAAKLFFEILKTILNQNLSLLLSVFLGAAFYLAGISYSKIAMVDTMRELLAAKIKSLSRLNT